MIDTHAHVHVDAYDGDRPTVLTRAFASGVRALLEVNITAGGWPGVRRLAESDPRIFAALGVHPNDAEATPAAVLGALLEREISHPRVRAVGETGLDYYRDRSSPEIQQASFRRHIAAAREADLPLVVHCRKAHDDVLKLLAEEGRGKVRGVMHCFSGDLEIARKSLDIGFRLGLGGSITYDAARWRPLVRAVGLEALVLETDCPYLTPEPDRGRRNEPARVWQTAQALAAYLDLTVEEVEASTDRTAVLLFGLDVAGPAAPERMR